MQENDILNSADKEFFNSSSTIGNTKNIRIWDGPTLDEKIDYIYKTLKAQKRNGWIKLVLKLSIVWALVYFFYFYLPSLPQEKTNALKTEIQTIISKKISETVTPMVKTLTQDLLKDMNIWWTMKIPAMDGVDINKISKEILNTDGKISTDKVTEFLKKHPELKDKIKQ